MVNIFLITKNDHTKGPSNLPSAADRMRSCRERRRKRFKIARGVAYPDALPLALCDEGLLDAWDTENLEAVAKAIEAALIALCVYHGYAVTPSDDDAF